MTFIWAHSSLSISLPPGTNLVQTLIQLGPDITSDPETIRSIFLRFNISDTSPPRDPQVLEIVATLATCATEGTPLCDVGAVIRAIASFVRSLFAIVTLVLIHFFCRGHLSTGPASFVHSIDLTAWEWIPPH
jgi:hypothetical protein